MKEVWKDINNYEGYYQASNLGRIKSLKRIVNHPYLKKQKILERIIKQSYDSRKMYLQVTLTKNGKPKKYLTHRIIAKTFLQKKGNNLEVNHKDLNKNNNNTNNLEWVTRKENVKHQIKNGHFRHKLNKEQVLKIRKEYIPYKCTAKMLSEKYGVCAGTIDAIVRKKIWKNL